MNRTTRRAQAREARQSDTCRRHGIDREGSAFAAYFTRSRRSRSTRRAS